MTKKSASCLIGPIVFGALGFAACSPSSSRGAGVTSAQPADQCLPTRASCVTDNDCCSLFCANNVCVRKSP